MTTPRIKVSADEISRVRANFPNVPADYLTHLTTVGYGQQSNGRHVYAGPVLPKEIYGERLENSSIILLGDDGMGYCFGFDLECKSYGELSDKGEWEPWPSESVFDDYLN